MDEITRMEVLKKLTEKEEKDKWVKSVCRFSYKFKEDMQVLDIADYYNCSDFTVIADEHIDRIILDVKVTCLASTKEEAESYAEQFKINAKVPDFDKTALIFKQSSPHFFRESTADLRFFAEYTFRVPKSLSIIMATFVRANITVKGFEGKMSLGTKTGRILVEYCSCPLADIITETGDILFYNNTVGKDIFINSESGDIRISVPDTETNGCILAKTKQGRAFLFNDNFIFLLK